MMRGDAGPSRGGPGKPTMTMNPIQALLAFTMWTFALVVGVLLYRGLRFLRGTPINHWPRSAKPGDDAPLVRRLEDAHANCLENLPIFAVLVGVAVATGQAALIAPVAGWVPLARVGQSLAHLSGTGQVAVFVRAGFWVLQLLAFGWMGLKLLQLVS